MKQVALVVAGLVLGAGALAQERDWGAVEIKTTQMGPGVWMLEGAGGNIGVAAGEDGVVLVDDQFAPLTDRIREAVAKISSRPLRFVLNTHWHGDHTGGNENLGKAGVLIVAHDNVRRRMAVEQIGELLGRTTPPSPKAALPVVTFSDAVTFHLNRDEVHAFHVPPAHTDGDAIVHFRKADVLHAGDLFFNGNYPFVDVDSGGSLVGLIAAVDRMLALAGPKTQIIPGHGPRATRADLEAYRAMLATVRDRLAPLVAAGKSADEIAAMKPLADLDEKWASSFMTPERFARIAALSLARER